MEHEKLSQEFQSMSLRERVKELGERVKKNQIDLNKERETKKKRAEISRELEEAPNSTQTDFFCRTCNKECIAIGYKRIHHDGQGTYLAQCPNGHGVVRYINNKWRDPYWELSPRVRRDRLKHADDMLTPNDPRFAKVYPQQWKAIQARKEEHERQTKFTQS